MLRERESLTITWGRQRLDLHSGKAIYWKSARTLIIADLHLGKAASFRSNGVPVPAGTTQSDLSRLSHLLHQTRAKKLIVLGDLLHAKDGCTPQLSQQFAHWRRQHDVGFTLVRGNHDERSGDPPTDWNVTCVDGPVQMEPFVFCHDLSRAVGYQSDQTHSFVMAGHVHPCAVMVSSSGGSMRAPCFVFGRNTALLPAFGSFTGMHPIQPRFGDQHQDRVFAIGPQTIVEVKTLRV